MLFVHLPAGFLAAYFTRKIWAQNLPPKRINFLYFLGAIFGLFPDLDGLYFYFVSAVLPHREHITHSFIFYIVIWLILYFVSRFLKNNFLKALSFVFFFASFFHLLLDSLGHGVMWFYPFSTLTFGLLSFAKLARGFYGQFFSFIDLFLETVISLTALNIFFFLFFKKYLKKSLAISYLVFLVVIFILYISWPYLYHGQTDIYYKDKDKDKIANLRDLDLDGDGILNISDKDADGDGRENIYQILETAKKMEGVWYDKREGGFWEIPARLGSLSRTDVVIKSYNAAGIFFERELQEDFKKSSRRYLGNPKDSTFDRRPYNLFIFFKNNGMLEDGTKYHEGDVVFFGEKVSNIGLGIDGSNKVKNARILTISERTAKFLLKEEAEEKFGKIIGVGRLNITN